ncbi:hypothetical protein GGI25_000023 [Coemansia spiralis]|uniref:DUF6314 domain-containing protein n=2 Tax=Coemansia TaxID=4863 RepID=A0A9W8KZQ4_9FUNG|nr:hypothetical protein EDC05_004403 [Coemansia umbellata]KAJ2623102.1 hypothetical protein GGI26_002712 [Coemansia sp. RSA 1358]KAJ2681069.1 hypothetical protein GGI25_000023 [Coemansia spiralis]
MTASTEERFMALTKKIPLFNGDKKIVTLGAWKTAILNAFDALDIEDEKGQYALAVLCVHPEVASDWREHKSDKEGLASPKLNDLLEWLKDIYDDSGSSFSAMNLLKVLQIKYGEDIHTFNKTFEELAHDANVEDGKENPTMLNLYIGAFPRDIQRTLLKEACESYTDAKTRAIREWRSYSIANGDVRAINKPQNREYEPMDVNSLPSKPRYTHTNNNRAPAGRGMLNLNYIPQIDGPDTSIFQQRLRDGVCTACGRAGHKEAYCYSVVARGQSKTLNSTNTSQVAWEQEEAEVDMSVFFRALCGRWEFERVITHDMGHDTLHARGSAVFKETESGVNELHYREQGVLSCGGGLEFHREYVYRYVSSQGVISVYFVENGRSDRLFHMLKFVEDGAKKAKGTHLCGDDMYNTTYKVFDDRFEVIHDVRGPRKCYTSVTTFRKI